MHRSARNLSETHGLDAGKREAPSETHSLGAGKREASSETADLGAGKREAPSETDGLGAGKRKGGGRRQFRILESLATEFDDSFARRNLKCKIALGEQLGYSLFVLPCHRHGCTHDSGAWQAQGTPGPCRAAPLANVAARLSADRPALRARWQRTQFRVRV